MSRLQPNPPQEQCCCIKKQLYIFTEIDDQLVQRDCAPMVYHGVKTMAEPTIQSSKQAQHRILAYGQDSDEREFSVPERQFGAKTKA